MRVEDFLRQKRKLVFLCPVFMGLNIVPDVALDLFLAHIQMEFRGNVRPHDIVEVHQWIAKDGIFHVFYAHLKVREVFNCVLFMLQNTLRELLLEGCLESIHQHWLLNFLVARSDS